MSQEFVLTEKGQIVAAAKCDTCGLAVNCKPNRAVFGHGPIEAQVAVVGEAPGANEWRTGIPFIGNNGKLLDVVLQMAGLKRKDVFVTNTVLCRPEGNRTPTSAEMAACKGRLTAELKRLPNLKVILVCGNSALEAIMGMSKITEQLGTFEWSEEWQAFLVPTYHPAAVLRMPGFINDLTWAFKKAADLLELPAGPIKRVETEWIVEDEITQCVERIRDIQRQAKDHIAKHGSPMPIACDLETRSLDWANDPIISMGFSWMEGQVYLIPNTIFDDQEVIDALDECFADENLLWIWHNGQFDTEFLKEQYDYRVRIDIDTMLLHHEHDENTLHDLKSLARKFCGAPKWKDEMEPYMKKGRVDLAPKNLLYQYHAYDVDYTLRLYHALVKSITKEQTLEPSKKEYPSIIRLHRELIIPATNALADIERRGIHMNVDVMDQLKEEVGQEKADLARECCELMGRQINLNSFKQVAEFMYDELKLPLQRRKGKGLVRTTDEEAMQVFINKHPFFAKMIEYRGVAKLYGTYIEGFEKRMDKLDQRIYASFRLHGTVTGRLASRDPNMQNIPRGSRIKSMFAATPGYTLIEADYSQLEVRVFAWYSRDAALIADINSGDIHWAVAQRIFAKHIAFLMQNWDNETQLDILMKSTLLLKDVKSKYDHGEYKTSEDLAKAIKKQLRHMVKYVTFGIMYQRGADSLAKGELQCPTKEADEYIQNFYNRYAHGHDFVIECKRNAKEQGWVETAFGRRRRFPFITPENWYEIEKQCVNAPIQSMASDICLTALTRLHKIMQLSGMGYVLWTVHDAIYTEVKNEYLEEAVPVIRETMENAFPNDVIDFKVDIKTGQDWYNMKDWEHAA